MTNLVISTFILLLPTKYVGHSFDCHRVKKKMKAYNGKNVKETISLIKYTKYYTRKSNKKHKI